MKSKLTDKTIITLSESLYRGLSLKRVYYSAFVPVTRDSRLPVVSAPPLKRSKMKATSASASLLVRCA